MIETSEHLNLLLKLCKGTEPNSQSRRYLAKTDLAMALLMGTSKNVNPSITQRNHLLNTCEEQNWN